MFGVNFDIMCMKNGVIFIFLSIHLMSKGITDFGALLTKTSH